MGYSILCFILSCNGNCSLCNFKMKIQLCYKRKIIMVECYQDTFIDAVRYKFSNDMDVLMQDNESIFNYFLFFI